MYSALTIADEILKIAKKAGHSLTPLQLMKLVYIAHGWSLAIREKDLFSDRIEAWKYGPVIPDLYRATKHFGRAPIPFDQIDEDTKSVDDDTYTFLEDVFKKYGHMSGYMLSSLTHKSGTPWDQKYQDGVYNVEISDDIIKEHYTALLNDRNVGTTTS